MEDNELQSVIEDFAKEIISDIRENMSSYGLGDSRLVQSLEPEIEGNHLKIWANDYFEYAEKGRGPGRIPFNFSSILEDWISQRNITYEGDRRQFANAIAWKTAREGSYLYRHPGEQRDFLDGILDDNVKSLEKNLIVQVKNQYKKDIL